MNSNHKKSCKTPVLQLCKVFSFLGQFVFFSSYVCIFAPYTPKRVCLRIFRNVIFTIYYYIRITFSKLNYFTVIHLNFKHITHSSVAVYVVICAESFNFYILHHFQKFINFFKNLGLRIWRSLKEMVAELKKVTWPQKGDLINYTLVVLAFMLVMGVVIFAIDAGSSALVQLITK